MKLLTRNQIESIKENYPLIPDEYLSWITDNGWGEDESGYMIYSSPAYSTEIFGTDCPENIKSVVLVGDDMAGYSIGYKVISDKAQLVGIDSCGWDVEEIQKSFDEYLES